MGRIYYQQFKALSVTAAPQDLCSIIAGANNPIRLLGFEFTSNATTSSIIDLDVHRITAAGTGGTFSTTEEPADENDSAPTASVRTLDTVPGTSGDGLMGWQCEQLGPVNGLLGGRELQAKPTEGFAFGWNTATSATVSGWICWEEL